jgi:hypothetical protein
MPRVCFHLALVVLSAHIPALAQHATPSPLDVAYVTRVFYEPQAYDELQAYNVDPKTGIPTAVGPALIIAENGVSVIPSPNGHFVYILAWYNHNHEQLRVFATGDDGALQQPPVQVLSVNNVQYFQIDPNGKFAYAVTEGYNDQEQTVATILEASVDQGTGLLGNLAKVVGPSMPNGPCGTEWSATGFLRFDGFNTDGSKFYYDWFCTTHDSLSATYFARNVDVSTGMLGPKTTVLKWAEDDSVDGVWFTPRALIDYADPAGVVGDSAVTVFPPSGGLKPLISCGQQMLELCASNWGAIADPAGVFMFLQATPYDAIVTAIDLATNQLVPTGVRIPRFVEQISPDRTLLYTYASDYRNPYFLTIYVFDPNTGAVQPGGTIEVPGESYSLVSAVRK